MPKANISQQINTTRIHHVVLTGGPEGGKSTAWNAVKAQHPNDVSAVPEVATILLSGGFPPPDEVHPISPGWKRSFQLAVAMTQIGLEQIFEQRAHREGKRLWVQDRGLNDGAAYLPGGVAELENLTGLSEAEMLARYDTVIHLPTTAHLGTYGGRISNPHRLEEAAQAIELDHKILEAWQNHPNRIIIDHADRDARMAAVQDVISNLLHDE